MLRAQHRRALPPQIPSAPISRWGPLQSMPSRRLGPLWHGSVLCPLLATGPHSAPDAWPDAPRPQPPAWNGPWDPRQACLFWVSLPPPLPGARCQVQNSWVAVYKQQRAALLPGSRGPPSCLPSGQSSVALGLWMLRPPNASVLTWSSLSFILCPNLLLLRTRYIILRPILMTSFLP